MGYEYTRRFQNTEDTRKIQLLKIQVEALRTRLADDARDVHSEELAKDMRDLDGYLSDTVFELSWMLTRLEDDSNSDFPRPVSPIHSYAGGAA